MGFHRVPAGKKFGIFFKSRWDPGHIPVGSQRDIPAGKNVGIFLNQKLQESICLICFENIMNSYSPKGKKKEKNCKVLLAFITIFAEFSISKL
jgi:hypothetical protein